MKSHAPSTIGGGSKGIVKAAPATTTTMKRKRPAPKPLASPPFSLNAPCHQPQSTTKNKSDHLSNDFDQVFANAAGLLDGRKNIMVLVGAGISVSCGIPDFRSKDSGLYHNLDIHSLGLSCPEELFDWDFFQEDPSPFYKFARNLYFPLGPDRQVQPSDSHKLLAMLEQNKRLLRVYTQNIDGLETVAGVTTRKTVFAHGSLRWATCTECRNKVSCDEIMDSIRAGEVARCQQATRKKASRRGSNSSTASSISCCREPSQRIKRKPKPHGDDVCGGVLKPGVTFFGEALNDNVRRALEADREKVDALIVIGTSLSVAPISKVIEYLPTNIPRLLINRTVVHPSTKSEYSPTATDSMNDFKPFRENYVFDAYLLGYCDDVTRALARRLFQDVHSETAGNEKKKRKQKANPYSGKLLTTVLTGEDPDMPAEDWEAVSVPKERVLLFPGALPSKEDATEVSYREIAHCDGCSKQIRKVIQKCTDCFDYDLCQKCYPSLSKTHFDGQHTFVAEPIAR